MPYRTAGSIFPKAGQLTVLCAPLSEQRPHHIFSFFRAKKDAFGAVDSSDSAPLEESEASESPFIPKNPLALRLFCGDRLFNISDCSSIHRNFLNLCSDQRRMLSDDSSSKFLFIQS